METDFNISVEGFRTNEEARSVGNIVLEVTKNLEQRFSLDISKLKKILISNDFGNALEKVTSEYNHSAPSYFTQSKQATAIAQLVSKIGTDGLCDEYTLVLSIYFFVELFDESGSFHFNKSTIQPIIHKMHHELIHIHEKNTLTCLNQGLRVNEYGDVLLISATRVWSEYLANFISSKTVTKEILDDFLTNLESVIAEVPKEIDEYVWKFVNSIISLNEMYLEVKKRIRLIVNSYGYAIGYVHGNNINLDEYSPELSAAISNSKLDQPLRELSISLKKTMAKYTNNEIKGFDDFRDIYLAIENVFNAFSITLECEGWSQDYNLSVYIK